MSESEPKSEPVKKSFIVARCAAGRKVFMTVIEVLIENWIREHVRPQKSVRMTAHSYPMKGLVERDLGCYITEEQFVSSMLKLGYETDGLGHFNSILVSKKKYELDTHTSWRWGLNPYSLVHRRKTQQKSLEELKQSDEPHKKALVRIAEAEIRIEQLQDELQKARFELHKAKTYLAQDLKLNTAPGALDFLQNTP